MMNAGRGKSSGYSFLRGSQEVNEIHLEFSFHCQMPALHSSARMNGPFVVIAGLPRNPRLTRT